MRQFVDRILRAGIKLCMLTGVSFLVTACYAPAPSIEPDVRGYSADSTYRRDQQKVEHQLLSAAQDQNE